MTAGLDLVLPQARSAAFMSAWSQVRSSGRERSESSWSPMKQRAVCDENYCLHQVSSRVADPSPAKLAGPKSATISCMMVNPPGELSCALTGRSPAARTSDYT
jgi:hypothetical protein